MAATGDSVPTEYINCLKTRFSIEKFLPEQYAVIASIIKDRQDNFLITASAYGKSLCYQFPSVYLNTITLVVSPLLSLMQDQVLQLQQSNISACELSSAQKNPNIADEIIEGKYNIIYSTPEYIVSRKGEYILERIREYLTLIAVDEAQCIVKWGRNIRSDFRELSKLRQLCPLVPILAVASSITKNVRNEIINILRLRDVRITTTPFDRSNLEFLVKQKTEVWSDIGPYIQNVKGSIVIFCITRQIAESVASTITLSGQSCAVYHPKIDERRQVLEDFLNDRIHVLVATVSLAFGINKSNVRLVIHYGVAKDLEGYYQELGRAGRDGQHAQCIMFQDPNDWETHKSVYWSYHEHIEIDKNRRSK